MFKADWESKPCPIDDTALQACILDVLGPFEQYKVLSGGHANANIEVVLPKARVLLRLYVRDPKTAFKEQAVYERISKRIPVPSIDTIGTWQDWTYAVIPFIEGQSLRDHLKLPEEHWQPLMTQAGRILGELRQVIFAKPGDLDATLEPISHPSIEEFLETSLQHDAIKDYCSKELQFRLSYCLKKFGHLLEEPSEPTLVHGDYDPANILVASEPNPPSIAAVLDWEFAFSGSFLWDVANMLRYAHRMSPAYQVSFVEGLQEGGVELPENWQKTTALMNVSSLVDLLIRTQKDAKRRVQDITELLNHFCDELIGSVSLKNIEVLPYQSRWPEDFNAIKKELEHALSNHIIALHHVGSTSVPGLSAKSDIDVLCVVDDLTALGVLEQSGFVPKGEFNIPLRAFFSKNDEERKVNLHVVPEHHPLIEQLLCFRDYLRAHPKALQEYQVLKLSLLEQAESFEKHPQAFSSYTMNKNDWIKETLKKAGFKGLGFYFCVHQQEKEVFSQLFSDSTLLDKHQAWVMYQGAQIIGAARVGDSITIKMMPQSEHHRADFEEFILVWQQNYVQVYGPQGR